MTEELETTLGRDEERYEETELRETPERLLTREELDITQAPAEGFTQAETARGLGVTQQAAAARVKKSRAKLRSSLYDENGKERQRRRKNKTNKNIKLLQKYVTCVRYPQICTKHTNFFKKGRVR